ncbi:transglycosylase SLT domain-containing protein [Endobacter medicaginis]|uniref:Transglycosylase SLT domain-containing protein n=1 Tax=Endobacter medicaginis TaxID=1181271 RepID=A0A850NPQ9_9PROT|nr:transglycosylase SLT domain-containing protein [Endobacter medicaginis]
MRGRCRSISKGRLSRKLILLATASLLFTLGTAHATPLDQALFSSLTVKCAANVAPLTMASIAATETGFEPYTVHDNTTRTSGVFQTAAEATNVASRLVAVGDSVDLGLMQINSKNLPMLGLSVADTFDPCTSLSAAALILGDAYTGGSTHDEQQAALRVAISRYNTGDSERGFTNGYVGKVDRHAAKFVPALDVRPDPDAKPLSAPTAADAAPTDPNAPPGWDVWASYDYQAAKDAGKRPSPEPATPTAQPASAIVFQ